MHAAQLALVGSGSHAERMRQAERDGRSLLVVRAAA
jgi:hypothetical protein